MDTLDATIFVRDIDVRAADHQTCRDLMGVLYQRRSSAYMSADDNAAMAGAFSAWFDGCMRP